MLVGRNKEAFRSVLCMNLILMSVPCSLYFICFCYFQVMKTWPLTTVRRWAASPNSFTLVCYFYKLLPVI